MPVTFIPVLICAAAARFFLVVNIPLRILPDEAGGDGLFMRLASNLASGTPLDAPSHAALLKEPGYPFFLTAVNLSGLPISAAHALVQIAAISAAAWAVLRLTKSQASALATLIALILCPVGLDLHRVLPDQIYWALTLLAVALLVIVVLAPPRSRFAAIVVAALAGSVFGWVVLGGNDGTWILPGCAFLVGGAVLLTRRDRDGLVALARNLSVMAAGFIAVALMFPSSAFHAYGSPASTAATGPQQGSISLALFAAVQIVWHPRLLETVAACSVSVESDRFRQYWKFLNKPRVRAVPPNREVNAVGWYYNSESGEWPVFKAYNQDGQEVPLSLARQNSPDLQRFFSDERAGQIRFQVAFYRPDMCVVTVRTSDGHELSLIMDRNEPLHTASGSALLNIDAVSDGASDSGDLSEKLATSISAGLNGVYEGLMPFLLPVGLIAAFAATWRAYSARALPATLWTALAAWILAATRTIQLALQNGEAFPAAGFHYSAPAHHMAIFAACLSLIMLGVGSRPE